MENENEKEVKDVKEEKKEEPHDTRTCNDTVLAGLSYFLFFLPLCVTPTSKLGRFHANQSLVILILSVINSIVFGWIWGWRFVEWPINLVLFGAWIYGMLAAFEGKFTKIPLLGEIKLIR